MLCRPFSRARAFGKVAQPSQSQSQRRCFASDLDKRKVIFSGIQPTGVPHLGNYLGALKQWVKLQNEAAPDTKLLYSIVDLHAITVPQQAPQLRQWKRETLAALLAVGLNPERSIIFYQSSIPAHTELMWILSCTASMGYLSRMTQWKSKLGMADTDDIQTKKAQASLKLGLFSYPVLQAADIMVHRATHVPVGEDQQQHLEFARNCATGFNSTYGAHLVLPETILSPARRIMSLTDPEAKMSKSHPNPKSRIILTDTSREIDKKIMSAITDSQTDSITFDPKNRPGVSNLLKILSAFEGKAFESEDRSAANLATEFPSGQENKPLKELKKRLSAAVVAELQGIRERYLEFLAKDDGKWLDDVEAVGAEKARASAEETMKVVREAVGF